MIKVIMHGCNGRMGQTITELLRNDTEARIVAGVDMVDCRDNGYPVFTNLADCNVEADVVIDFASAKAVDGLLEYCVERNLPVVLCTTGLSNEQLISVEEASKKIAVLRSGNMSLGINTIQKLVAEAAKILEEKKALVASLVEKMKNSPAGVLVNYKGINVEDDTKLRRQLREAGVYYAVVKNTMIRFAAKELGYEALDEHLNGTTALAIATGDDVVTPAKILNDYAKDHENFTIKAGYLEGAVVSADEVIKLAKMPSKETLIAQTLYSFNYPIMQLAIALNAIAEKAGEGADDVQVATLVAAQAEAAEEAAAE